MDIKELKQGISELVIKFQNEHGIAIESIEIKREQKQESVEVMKGMKEPVICMTVQVISSMNIGMSDSTQKLEIYDSSWPLI